MQYKFEIIDYSPGDIAKIKEIIEFKKPTKKDIDKKWEVNYINVDDSKILSSKSDTHQHDFNTLHHISPKKGQLLKIAKTIPIFNNFRLKELLYIFKNAQILKYKPHTNIIHAGVITHSLYFIINGNVNSLRLTENGKYKKTNHYKKGELLNIYSFVRCEKLDSSFVSGEGITTIFKFEINDEKISQVASIFKKFYLNIGKYALEKSTLADPSIDNLLL